MGRSITPLLLGLPVLALLLWLGFWQLDRADQKRELQHAYAQRDAEPRRVGSAHALPALPRFTPVELEGRYDGAHQALLDAQVHEGRVGYRVWTPLVLDDDSRVLVDRGWLPAPPDRAQLPGIAVDGRHRVVRGYSAPLPRPGLRLGQGDATGDGWPRRLVWPDADALARVWRPAPAPALVLLAPSQPDGFVRDWDPVVFGPERHIGYAVQWFSLAGALMVIAAVLTFRRRRDDRQA